ncbi:MAG: D-amino-acid transaminase [Candidatus Reconcilbacillus cellulovorans]|uniref:D-alanine aminotransferase n=1 Tax=Candidatus Reconcilbacillus cellulovorans TaxID=1906605 RepID=A0A2A6DZC4_9BACL|nr:MAG: D-amino-acid transaminase [Candidatus Reconcilbacillus cellulovorans]
MHMIYGNRVVRREDVRISPLDRGYYFGDGVYEVIRVYAGRLFEADAHFRRLARSAEGIGLKPPIATNELRGLIDRLLALDGVTDGTVYLQMTRGVAPRTHAFPSAAEPVVVGWADPYERPVAAMEQGVRVVTVADIRWLRCDLKTLNLLPNVLARQQAVERGAAEAVLHRDGVVTEASAANVMIVKNGIIRTHPADHRILRGVTRDVVLRLACELGIAVEETPFTVDELYAADEAFLTGTTVEIMPIVEADGRPIGDGRPGPVVRRLQRAFAELLPET